MKMSLWKYKNNTIIFTLMNYMLSIVTGKVGVETFYFTFFLTDNGQTDQVLIAVVIAEV